MKDIINIKKFLVFAMFAIFFTSCYTDDDKDRLQLECKALTQQKENLQSTISRLNNRKTYLLNQIMIYKFKSLRMKQAGKLSTL